MGDYSYLSAYESEFNAAEQAASYDNPPEGRYNAILTSAQIFEPKPDKPVPRLSTMWTITEGSYKGAKLFINFNLNQVGAPWAKRYHAQLGFGQNANLMQIAESLPQYVGKMGVLSVVPNKKDPRYTNTYLDQVTGVGKVEDYIKPKAQPAAAQGGVADNRSFTIIEEGEDLPF